MPQKTKRSAVKKPQAKRPPAKSAARRPSKPAVKAQRVARPAVRKPAPIPAKKAAAKPAPKPPRAKTRPSSSDRPAPLMAKSRLGKKDLEFFRKQLLNLRDRIVDEISFLSNDNLSNSKREASGDVSNYGMHMADQGTDNFDREFALSLVTNEQEVLYEIDEALHRIDSGAFGICEMTNKPIEFERLKVLPYARYCREAQEEMERGRRRFRSFAPAQNSPPPEY